VHEHEQIPTRLRQMFKRLLSEERGQAAPAPSARTRSSRGGGTIRRAAFRLAI